MYSLFIYIYILQTLSLKVYLSGQITIFHLHPNFPEIAGFSYVPSKTLPNLGAPVDIRLPPGPRHRTPHNSNLESSASFTMQPFLGM